MRRKLCAVLVGMVVGFFSTQLMALDRIKVYYGDYEITDNASKAGLAGYTNITGDLTAYNATITDFTFI